MLGVPPAPHRAGYCPCRLVVVESPRRLSPAHRSDLHHGPDAPSLCVSSTLDAPDLTRLPCARRTLLGEWPESP